MQMTKRYSCDPVATVEHYMDHVSSLEVTVGNN